jgi:hypothetical protein
MPRPRRPAVRNLVAAALVFLLFALIVAYGLYAFEPQRLRVSASADPNAGRAPFTTTISVTASIPSQSDEAYWATMEGPFEESPLYWDVNRPGLDAGWYEPNHQLTHDVQVTFAQPGRADVRIFLFPDGGNGAPFPRPTADQVYASFLLQVDVLR